MLKTFIFFVTVVLLVGCSDSEAPASPDAETHADTNTDTDQTSEENLMRLEELGY